MPYRTIALEKHEAVGKIIFNRPEVLNAYNEELAGEIIKGFNELAAEASIGIIVMCGRGKAFMAGADINMVNRWAEKGDAAGIRRTLATLVNPNMLEDCPKPVIAAVNGLAFGMGFELALACDFRIAVKKARFALPEVKLGLIPGGGGSQRLLRLAGQTRALEMMATGEPIDATEAYRIGLLNELVETEEEMWEAVNRLTGRLSCLSPGALGVIKKLIYQGGARPLRQGIEYELDCFCEILLTRDAAEGTAAFLEKRKPVFKGL